jgi:HlyD family secretion protein
MSRLIRTKTTYLFSIMTAIIIAACSSAPPLVTPEATQESEETFDQVVSVTGVIVPARWATLSLATGGRVSEVMVIEDQAVTGGEVLIRLEGEESLQAAISAAELEVISAQQAIDALFEEPEVRVAQAAQAVVDAQIAVDEARRRLNNLGSASPKPDVDQARANLVLARDKLEKAREDFEPYANKPEDNLIRAGLLSKMAQAQKEYDAAVRTFNNLVGTANDLDVAEAEADLALAEAQLAAAQREEEVLRVGPDADQLALAEARLANAKQQLDSVQASLEDLVLTAPFDGTVSELFFRSSEWAAPGQPALVLADLSNLRVETTDLNEIDVGRIKVGDPATITFDAIPDILVNGKIVRIATKAAKSAGVNYTVVLEMAEIPPELRWGMTAFIDIHLKR